MRKIDEIIKQLEELIISGQWAVGMRLPSEAKLCEQFGASRTVIREALEQLRGRQLIMTIKGSGSYVKEFSSQNLEDSLGAYTAMVSDETNLRDLLELRELIEADAAARLAERRDAMSIARLEETISTMMSTRDLTRLTTADAEFHRILAEASGNKLFEMIVAALRRNYVALGQTVYSGDDRALQAVISQHSAVVSAIKNGSPEGAAEAMRTHIRGTRSKVRETHGL